MLAYSARMARSDTQSPQDPDDFDVVALSNLLCLYGYELTNHLDLSAQYWHYACQYPGGLRLLINS